MYLLKFEGLVFKTKMKVKKKRTFAMRSQKFDRVASFSLKILQRYWTDSLSCWLSRNMCKLCVKIAFILPNIWSKIPAGLRLRATII